MPIYPYKCKNCGFIIENNMSISEMERYEKEIHNCPKCNGILKRSYDYNFSFILKGNGFYVNDKNKK